MKMEWLILHYDFWKTEQTKMYYATLGTFVTMLVQV